MAFNFLPQNFPSLNCIDISRWGGQLSASTADCLIAKGIKLLIVGVGNPQGAGLYAHQQATMWLSRGGETIGAYIYLYQGDDPVAQITTAMEVLKDVTVSMWALDFEDVSDAANAMNQTDTRAFMWKCIREMERRTIQPVVYSGKWWFDPHVGNTTEFGEYNLWDACYPYAASVDNPVIMPWAGREYGGFSEPIIYQYKGTVNLCGFSVDLSWLRSLNNHMIDQDILDIKNLIVGNGYDCVPWEDVIGEPTVLDLFPSGTKPIPRGTVNPVAIRLIGENAFQYAKRRGFSFGLALANLQASSASGVNVDALSKALEDASKAVKNV